MIRAVAERYCFTLFGIWHGCLSCLDFSRYKSHNCSTERLAFGYPQRKGSPSDTMADKVEAIALVAASSDGVPSAVPAGSEAASGVQPLDVVEVKVDGQHDPSLCTVCKKPVDEENSIVVVCCVQKQPVVRRCKACHALKSRINRVVSKHGALAADWTQVSDAEKKEFYQNYQTLAGPDLLARLQETVTESKRRSSAVEFVGTGEYLDEADMNERYKHKPEQLANIFANTRNYFCAVRQVWLYEDVKYQRTARDAEEVCRVDKRNIQMIPKEQAGGDDGNLGLKKPKKKHTPDSSDLPKLKAGEKKKIGKKMEAMTTKRLHLMDLCAKAKGEKLKAMVPTYVLEAADKILEEAQTFTGSVEDCLAKERGNLKEILEGMDQQTEVLTDGGNRVKCQVEQAMLFLTELEK